MQECGIVVSKEQKKCSLSLWQKSHVVFKSRGQICFVCFFGHTFVKISIIQKHKVISHFLKKE